MDIEDFMMNDEELEELLEAMRDLPFENIGQFRRDAETVKKGLMEGRYLVNACMARAVTETAEFFKYLNNDRCERDIEVEIVPFTGTVRIYFYVLDIGGEDLETFNDIIQNACSVTVSVSDDGRSVMEITVTDVFVRADMLDF